MIIDRNGAGTNFGMEKDNNTRRIFASNCVSLCLKLIWWKINLFFKRTSKFWVKQRNKRAHAKNLVLSCKLSVENAGTLLICGAWRPTATVSWVTCTPSCTERWSCGDDPIASPASSWCCTYDFRYRSHQNRSCWSFLSSSCSAGHGICLPIFESNLLVGSTSLSPVHIGQSPIHGPPRLSTSQKHIQ